MVIDDDYLRNYLKQLGYVKTRCKGCKYWNGAEGSDKGCCMVMSQIVSCLDDAVTPAEHYCGWGEAKCANG